MQLDRTIQPLQHTDSRRVHPTTQLNTSNSHTRGTPNSRGCSWSTPIPRECSISCASVMVVCRQRLDYWVAPSSKNISPQPRPDPLGSCIATAWSHPTDICWLRRRTSTVVASSTTPLTVRLRTRDPILTPLSPILNGLAFKKTKKQTGLSVYRVLYC